MQSTDHHARDAELRSLLAQSEELCARSQDLCAQSQALRAQFKEISSIRQTFLASYAFEAGSGGWRGLAWRKRGHTNAAHCRVPAPPGLRLDSETGRGRGGDTSSDTCAVSPPPET
jgi:hypothetical protein